jgi:uncharacterized membrane protein YdbT with pleckstrin-like domain
LSYYKKVLRPGETVHFLGSVHWFVYLHGLLMMALAFVVACGAVVLASAAAQPGLLAVVWGLAALFALAGLVLLAGAAIARVTTEIVVTDLRVIHKRGLISRHTVEMNITKIETVDVTQGLIGRIFGYGTVMIRGTGAGFEPLRNVADPLSLRNAILVG